VRKESDCACVRNIEGAAQVAKQIIIKRNGIENRRQCKKQTGYAIDGSRPVWPERKVMK
jgi:hypothetical protein